MNFDPFKKITNPKQLAKIAEQERERASAIVRSADYKAQSEKIDAPFGKTFKTGAHKDAKQYKREKHSFNY